MKDVAYRIAEELNKMNLLSGTEMPSFHLITEALEKQTTSFCAACKIVNEELLETVAQVIRNKLIE